jgi:hypothetical protein
MKLVKVEVRYACGTVLVDRATFDTETRRVQLPLRFVELMAILGKTESVSAFRIETGGRILPVVVEAWGEFRVSAHDESPPVRWNTLRSLVVPNRDQRHANGRFVHMLSVAALIGGVFEAMSVAMWNTRVIAEMGSLAFAALLLGAVGFYCKGD